MPKIKHAVKKKTDLVVVIAKEVSPIVTHAQSLVINDPASMKVAVAILSKLNSYLDRLTEDKERLTLPLNATIKEVRSRYKPQETILTAAIAAIRDKLSFFQTAAMKAQKEAEAKIASKVEAGTINLETAVAKLDAIEAPAQGIRTDAGLVNFKTVKKLKITSVEQIPDEYWVVDESALLEALKKGYIIPGAQLEDISVPVNYRS